MWVDRFAEHAPTIAAACCLASAISLARAGNAWRLRRTKRGCADLLLGSFCSVLLGGAAAVLVAGLIVETIPNRPWMVAVLAAGIGTAADLTTAAGSLRLLRLALRMFSRVSRTLASEIASESRSGPDSE